MPAVRMLKTGWYGAAALSAALHIAVALTAGLLLDSKPEYIVMPLIRDPNALELAMQQQRETPPAPAPARSAASPPAQQPEQTPQPAEEPPAAPARPSYVPAETLSHLPLFRTRIAPAYPAAEKAAGVESRVIAEVFINESGGVDDIIIVKSGGAAFDAAVVNALRQSSFEPGTLNGRPVAVRVQIPFVFKLR